MIVLVTGATGGFGAVLARVLRDAGMTVYGTGRSVPADAADADGIRMIPMDVSSDDSVAAAIRAIVDREGRLDVVVNCVNEMVIGMVEEQSADEVARLYETNVFGALRIWQQALPVMRAQGAGLLVTMSSLGGLLAVPTMSAYTSSKFALEAMSEALHHELRGTGIDVVIMQPVAMQMDRPATGSHLRTVEGVAAGSRSLKMVEKMHADTEASGLTPEAVAERIRDVIRSPRRSLRVPMDRAKPLSLLKRLAPQSLIDRLIDGLLR